MSFSKTGIFCFRLFYVTISRCQDALICNFHYKLPKFVTWNKILCINDNSVISQRWCATLTGFESMSFSPRCSKWRVQRLCWDWDESWTRHYGRLRILIKNAKSAYNKWFIGSGYIVTLNSHKTLGGNFRIRHWN